MSASGIAVLLSMGFHPSSGRKRRADLDARALELGARISPGEIFGVHAGVDTPDLSGYFGMGLRHAVFLKLRSPEEDPADALAEYLAHRPPRLVLAGLRAETWPASAQTPYRVASRLGYDLLPAVSELTLTGDGATCIQPQTPSRVRRIYRKLPFVAAVSSAAPAPRPIAYAAARRGEVSILPVTACLDTLRSRLRRLPGRRVPGRLEQGPLTGTVEEKLAPLLDGPQDGGEVLTGVSAQEAASAILASLESRKLLLRTRQS